MKKFGGFILKIAIIAVLVLMVMFGLSTGIGGQSKAESRTGKTGHDFVSADGKTRADFFEPVYRQSRKEAKLSVFSQDVDAPGEVTQDGLFKIPFLQKYQEITYKATVEYSIDLSDINEKGISVNNRTKAVTVVIPKPAYQIVLQYGKFEFKETKSKSIFPATEIKLNLEEVQKLEEDAAKKIQEKIDSNTDLEQKAENAGIEQVTSVLKPAVSGVDKDYELIVKY